MKLIVATAVTTCQPPIDTPATAKRECCCFDPDVSVQKVMDWAHSLEGRYTAVGTVELCESQQHKHEQRR